MFSADQIWNNLLKAIAEEAFGAGNRYGEHFERTGGYGEQLTDFDEWWETFVEQNRTDG